MGISLVLCYRSSRVVNLAQGETYVGSAMFSSKLMMWGFPFVGAAAAGMAFAILASAALERYVLRPRLNWPVSRIVIITAGMAILAEGVYYALLGPNAYTVNSILNGPAIRVDGAVIAQQAVLAIVVSALLAVGLTIFFGRTVLGHRLNAMAERPMTAELVGINAGRLRLASYAMAGILGSVAALLIVPLQPITYDAGLTITLSAYIAAAVGGMNRVGLTWLAGMGIGLAESFYGTYVNVLMAQPVVLGVLLLAVVTYLARGVRFSGAVRA